MNIEKQKNKIAIVTGVIGVLLVTVTGIYVVSQNKTAQVEKSTPPVQKPVTSVSALGRIEPLNEVINVAPSPTMAGAKVKVIFIKEGDVVKKGQFIAITTDYDVKEAELERAKEELKVAQANLAIVKAGAKEGTINAQSATIERLQAELKGTKATDKAKIARLQAQLTTEKAEKLATIKRYQAEVDNAQAEFTRYQQLAKDGVISQSQLENKALILAINKKSLQEAQASYQKTKMTLAEEIKEIEAQAVEKQETTNKQIVEARAKLDEIAEVREVDVIKAEAEVTRAMALIKQIEVDRELTVIKAPTNGTIIDVIAQEGENIETSQGVVQMADTSQMIVVAEVYESDINQIQVGQTTNIVSENNSFDDRIQGKVIEISSKIGKKDVLETDPAASVDARVVEVKIAIDAQENALVKNLIYSQVIVKILL
jgi:HlyD family secretion protein